VREKKRQGGDMDNSLQIEEIKRYQRHLEELTGEKVDEEIAALLWIRKYAHSWRLRESELIDYVS
jgi:hypothetical protein